MINILVSSLNSAGDESGYVHIPVLKYNRMNFSSSIHGSSTLSISALLCGQSPYSIYSRDESRKISVFDGGTRIWVGEIISTGYSDRTITIEAVGKWAMLKRSLYTGMISNSSYGDWFVVEDNELANAAPDRYGFDKTGRLHVSLKEGETYNLTSRAEIGLEAPHAGETLIESISFTYDITLPTGYICDLASYNYDLSGGVVEWTLSGNGAQQTGSVNLTSISKEVVHFRVYLNSGVSVAFTGETGSSYATINAIRVIGLSGASTIDSQAIIQEVCDKVATDLPEIFSESLATNVIAGHDIADVYYEDASVSSIVEALEDLGTATSTPLRFSFDGNGFPSFIEKSELSEVWLLNISKSTVSRKLTNAPLVVYAKYTNEFGRARRTSSAKSSLADVTGMGAVDFVEISTTSQAEAEASRDSFVANEATRLVKVSVAVDSARKTNSDLMPLYHIVAGDKARVASISDSLSLVFADNLNEFDIVTTSYDAISGKLEIELGSKSDSGINAIIEALTGDFDFIQI